ncbi:phosphoribosylaminoimidazolesuccinocarboxamide synthase [Weissella paramesenteroides]|jgi:phosphoribosylaminoimidazole-succinocarboxamide synthase|uniref:Phosphoribosylaminoimidazole-succinocarboxamide synthase n=1 Tax=Weissella paramesenteroides TaxID=1249 RepID=A0ABD4XII5_WEIPA|nr:phosphoribosylaminoimidazolesuccinocarboxamide synthase [Weissella paramesenteroides]KAA8445262.1 phosphoribosylaminoimidazolesuccinocarboxamide synthase [Weissella paramesenteroides]KAA8451840.1 phosphoribosylaminoimidazolesuccinocarboxamide synthase [Weissella paramesenteroides]MBU7556698.1 phosphoribosylaminoimidazolesuccinocarboxamide synthase [Weissella paramesenteroides]MCS9983422.1 phosphoribosylaminoimidazolesuccinocarboxamide synthase [Weissella paramesenteroides]MCS9997689.1 phosp
MTELADIEKQDLLYQGKAKEMYTTNDPEILWVHYMDQVTALNGKRKVQMKDKGKTNCAISSQLFTDLRQQGIENHFIKQLGPTDQLVQRVQIIPLETVVRNYASGSFVKRYQVDYLQKFEQPVIEFFYKSDALDDPFLNDDDALALGIATNDQIAEIRKLARQVNQHLIQIFAKMNVQLVDFKLEFGLTTAGDVILADELSPDNCRLVDMKTKESLDKDIFRKGLGEMVPVYEEILQRLQHAEEI